MGDSILTIVTNLVQQLSALAYEEYKLVKGVGDQLKSLENGLRFMNKFLRNSEGKQKEHELERVFVEQIQKAAFDAEDIIETFLLNVERHKQRTIFGKAIHYLKHQAMLHGVAKQIEEVKLRIDDIFADKDKYGIEIGNGSIDQHFLANLRRRRKEVDEDMVGFNDVFDSLLSQLIEGSTELEIISIVGMGGIGKTTVAKRLYNNGIIRDHFKNRAWFSVSEDYDTRQVILTILNNMVCHNLEKQETDELKKMLKTHLMKRRYIIILDDVWQTNMWDEVQACFPDTKNGSRILITTRDAHVARFASRREPLFLRFLEQEESWELFEKKVFRGYSCPTHLESLGIEIAKKCRGLPLSIVVIAGMLVGQEKSEKIWEKTLKDVSAHLEKDPACLDILALSYHSLPVELKPCFLYFAAYPEDCEISVRKLIALWLAEGFIQPRGKLTLEDVAEGYLDTLVDRSLVQAGMKRIDGGLKTCRIHDLIRDLCIREARNENFMLLDRKLNDTTSSVNKSKPRRLSVHSHTQDTILSKNWVPWSIRTLLSFENQKESVTPEFWKKLYTDYKLLRVLDLGFAISGTTVPDGIDELTNLRYLRFRFEYPIPKSIYKLRNLQMLCLMGSSVQESLKIPTGALLKLQSLQQLKLQNVIAKLCGKSKVLSLKKRLKLNNLQVLYSIVPDNDFEGAVMGGLFPNLRKLSLSCPTGHCWSLKKYFANLAYLQSLKICYSYSDVHRDVFKGIRVAELPSNLTKVTLMGGDWCNKSFNMLGEFPNLRDLKILNMEENACFTLREGLFPELHTLHLVMFKNKSLVLLASGDTLPNIFGQLRSLVIDSCSNSMFDRNLLRLPSLTDVQLLWPDDRLITCLEELKRNYEIKYRLLVYRGC